MKAILLILLLAHGGYWFGGEDNTIRVRWAAPEAGMPAAKLSWELFYASVSFGAGETDVAVGDKTTTLTMKLPEARTLAAYTWKYQLKEAKTGKVLDSGERVVYACPPKLLEGQARRMVCKRIIVIDRQEAGLTSVLKGAGMDVLRLESVGDVLLRKADVILVGEDQLPDNEATQSLLRTKAEEGAGVMIFAQQHLKRSLGFALRDRPLKGPLAWRADHELFDRLSAADLNAWVRESGTDLAAVALPADARVLEVGYWPRETPGDAPAPVDALVATETIGEGRIVWWQIPVGAWTTDPRAQILLGNALDYLLTRPEPTLPQAKRAAAIHTSPRTEQDHNPLLGEKP